MSAQEAPGTILIVDDEPDICDAMKLALTLEGYQVIAAQDRDAALTIIERERPTIVMLDFRMPGLTPGEFISRLQLLNMKIPVILMTAGKDPAEKARTLGLEHYLSKPFELDAMLDLVRICSSKSGGT